MVEVIQNHTAMLRNFIPGSRRVDRVRR